MVEKELQKASRNRHFNERPEDAAQPRDPERRFRADAATRRKSIKHLADYGSCTRGGFYCRLRIQLTANRKSIHVMLPKGVAVDQRFNFFGNVVACQVI